MYINIARLIRRSASAGVLVLFPGYVLYHYSIAQGWIPPILGGLFGPVSFLLAAECIVLMPWIISRSSSGTLLPAVFIGVALSYTTVWALVSFAFIRGEPYGMGALRETAQTVIMWIAMVFVGAFFSFDGRRARKTLIALSALIVAALLHSMFRYQSPLGPYLTFSGADPDAAQSTYQAIGRSILVTAVFLGALVRKPQYKLATFVSGALLLLLIGSRTDFFTLVVLCAVLAFQLAMAQINRVATFASLAGCALLLFLASPLFFETRSAEILDLSNSTSWQARHELQTAALKIISDNPVFGSFGYHWRDGGSGWYAHNALSAWTNFGLLGFLLFTGLIVYFTMIAMPRAFRAKADPVWFTAFHLGLAALVQAIGTSPVFVPLPALAWGVALNGLRHTTLPSAAADAVTSAA